MRGLSARGTLNAQMIFHAMLLPPSIGGEERAAIYGSWRIASKGAVGEIGYDMRAE